MAVSFGRVMGRKGKSPMFGTSIGENRNLEGRSHNSVRVLAYVGSSGLKEEYKTLRLRPGATEKEVKKAYRHLALQYHPDVCKGDNCGVQFEKINEAYQTVLWNLEQANKKNYYVDDDNSFVEVMIGDEWEEWMGWEGGTVTRDYSNHINLYA